MGVFFNRSDIPFAADDAHRFLPWLIGVMACLVALLLCLGITINGWIIDRSQDYSNRFTVNIPINTEDLGDKTSRVRDALKKLPGVTEVTQLSEEKLKEMLSTWLGNSDTLGDLPLPVVLEVAQTTQAHTDYDALQRNLSNIAPGIEVDAHERWAAAFSNFSATVQCLMLLLAALLLVAMGAMIAFTSRASLKLHAEVVHLLHAIGAEDGYITRQFQQEAFLLVLPGVAGGALVATILYWGTGIYMASLPVSLLPALTLTGAHFALVVLMPVLCAFGAALVANHSITQQLESVL